MLGARFDDLSEVVATVVTVTAYLTHPRGGGLTIEQAAEMILRHEAVLDQGEFLGSFASDVGDRLLALEGR